MANAIDARAKSPPKVPVTISGSACPRKLVHGSTLGSAESPEPASGGVSPRPVSSERPLSTERPWSNGSRSGRKERHSKVHFDQDLPAYPASAARPEAEVQLSVGRLLPEGDNSEVVQPQDTQFASQSTSQEGKDNSSCVLAKPEEAPVSATSGTRVWAQAHTPARRSANLPPPAATATYKRHRRKAASASTATEHTMQEALVQGTHFLLGGASATHSASSPRRALDSQEGNARPLGDRTEGSSNADVGRHQGREHIVRQYIRDLGQSVLRKVEQIERQAQELELLQHDEETIMAQPQPGDAPATQSPRQALSQNLVLQHILGKKALAQLDAQPARHRALRSAAPEVEADSGAAAFLESELPVAHADAAVQAEFCQRELVFPGVLGAATQVPMVDVTWALAGANSTGMSRTSGRSVVLQTCRREKLELSSWVPVDAEQPPPSSEKVYLAHARHRFPGALEMAGQVSLKATPRVSPSLAGSLAQGLIPPTPRERVAAPGFGSGARRC